MPIKVDVFWPKKHFSFKFSLVQFVNYNTFKMGFFNTVIFLLFFVHSFLHLFIYSFVRSFLPSTVCSFVCPLVCSFNRDIKNLIAVSNRPEFTIKTCLPASECPSKYIHFIYLFGLKDAVRRYSPTRVPNLFTNLLICSVFFPWIRRNWFFKQHESIGLCGTTTLSINLP